MSNALTEKQSRFVKAITEGYAPSDAANLAGYNHPHENASRLRKQPHIQKAIFLGCMAALTDGLLPKSIRRLEDILKDDSAVASGIKLKAAQYVIDKAQALQEMASAKDLLDKNPLEMSQAELEIFIARGRVVLTSHTKKREAMAELGIIEGTAQALD